MYKVAAHDGKGRCNTIEDILCSDWLSWQDRPSQFESLLWSPKCLLKGHIKRTSTQTKKKNNSKVGIPDFWVGFLEILEEDEGMNGKDEHDEDNSSRELENFIAAERLSHCENYEYLGNWEKALIFLS